ncbi:MAG: hypothetical protein WBM40_04285, partial [Thiohalocapsa sp.]
MLEPSGLLAQVAALLAAVLVGLALRRAWNGTLERQTPGGDSSSTRELVLRASTRVVFSLTLVICTSGAYG